MNAFDTATDFKVNGRVVDLGGQLINEPTNPITVTLEQSYGNECVHAVTVPVTGGFFEL